MLKYILKQSIIFRSLLNLLILATNYNLNIQIQIMDTPFVEEAIPMVSVDEKTGKYVLTPQAFKFLKAITGPIAVVSVAGLYRTGKSYLLNRVLLNRANGFGVGSTVNACTKGLWCWGTPIKGTSLDGEQVSIIVIDTEGIGALDEDQTHDTKIFTLAILASSVFIYNSVGSIDQNAVQNLSLVVNLTKHIQLKASGQDQDGQDPDQISSYFPTFYWVVRDFSLQLQDPQGNPISSKEYLEKALAPQNGFSDDIEQKNRIRRLLTAFFKDRDCITMIRPLVDEQKLQNLDKMEFNQLRPEFMQQALNFRKRIINSVKGKSLQNQKLNGDMYCSMMNSYVNAINEGAVPNIENAWNYMCQEQCRKALDDCYQFFIKQIKDNFKQFPKPEEEFQRVVSEAEEKTIEFFREKALGEKSVNFLKQLKNRMRNTITESREQNIKESNEIIRTYILKNVNPMKLKLNNHEYKSYPQFEKQLNLTFERITKDGPKLHSHKLVYTEAMRKFSAQGAQFLFKNFTKNQEKEREMNKLKQKQLTTQLQQATEQRQALKKKLMDYTISNDQMIADLNYKIETLTAQLKMTQHSKIQEQKKMERQLSAKHSQLESNRRSLEMKIKEMMEKLDESTKMYNNEKRQWEKEKAIFEIKVKQQSTQIDELSKKEKLLDANLNVTKNESVNQVRTITQRYENESNELKNRLKQMEEKNNEMSEELASLKEEMESKMEKFEKKERKYKEDISNKTKQIEKLNRDMDTQRKRMNEELERKTQDSSQRFKLLEDKLKQCEKTAKSNQEEYRKNKMEFERDFQMLKDKYEMMVSKYEQQKLKHTELKEKHQSFITKLEQSFKQKSEEAAVMKMNQVREEYETIRKNMESQFEKERNNFMLENNSLNKKIEDLQKQTQVMRTQNHKNMLEHKDIIQQLNEEITYLKTLKRTLEGQKETDITELQNRHLIEVENLKRQIEEIKQRSRMEQQSANKASSDVIQSLRAAFQIQKQQMANRLRKQKEKSHRRQEQLTEEYEKKIKELEQNLENQILDLQEKLCNTQELLRTQSSQLQHEIDINVKKAETIQKSYIELKETLEKKESLFNNKYEQIYQQSKQQRLKLEEKIEMLINENNKKDKDLMNTIHVRDNYMSSLEKKEARLAQLERESQQQKESLKKQIEALHNRISTLDAVNNSKATEYQKTIALATQENIFLNKNISDLTNNLRIVKEQSEKQIQNLKIQMQNQKNKATQNLSKQNKQLQAKLKQTKKNSKQSQAALKKSYQQLSKQKEALDVAVANLEKNRAQIVEKNKERESSLNSQLIKFREENSRLRNSLEKQTQSFQKQYDQLKNIMFGKTSQFQKEKSLLSQKIDFITQQKEQLKREADQKLKNLQNQLNLLREKQSSEKEQMGSKYLTTYKDNEAKLNSRVSELTNMLANKTFQYQRILKERQNEIKIIREQLQNQQLTRQSLMSKSQKRNGEYEQKLKRLKQEYDKYKFQKERRQTEMLKAQNTEKQQAKTKINSLENTVKQAEQRRMASYYEMEQLKTKWSMEKENFLDQLGNAQDLIKKYEKENGKFKIEIQKLKVERKNVKTHSFIGNLKTTYIEPAKTYVEEFNKENVGQQ